jgi:hypothetical protein
MKIISYIDLKHRILLCILNLLIILKSEIIEVADRSGLSNLDVEFNPASKSGLQVINVMISLKDGAVILINNRTRSLIPELVYIYLSSIGR